MNVFLIVYFPKRDKTKDTGISSNAGILRFGLMFCSVFSSAKIWFISETGKFCKPKQPLLTHERIFCKRKMLFLHTVTNRFSLCAH